MAWSPAFRVGVIVFIAIVAFILVYGFLRGFSFRAEAYNLTVIFDNSLGLMEGDPVQMAGVPIGSIQRISLTRDQKARVQLTINRRYRIPDGSRFIVRVGLLIGQRIIEVEPNRMASSSIEPNSTIIGEVPPRVEDLLPQAQVLVNNLTEASAGIRDLLADEQVRADFRQSIANVNSATARLDATMATLQNAVGRNQGQIDRIASNVAEATEGLSYMIRELRGFVARGDIQESLTASLAAARASVESLERTVSSLETLVTDPAFQEDIRTTVAGARETIGEARQALTRINKILGSRPRLSARIPIRGLNLDLLANGNEGRFRADLSTTLGLSNNRFVNLGIYDVGEGNKLILQPGIITGPNTDVRYGLYASKLGVGLDHSFSDRLSGRVDLFDPSELKLNLRGRYAMGDDWGVLFGVEGLFRNNQVALGVNLKR